MSKGIGILTRTLGDCVLVNTLARNIKLQYPDIDLDWIVEKKYLDIIKFNPDIKNIITLNDMGMEWNTVLKSLVNYDKVFMFQQTRPEDGTWHQNDKYRNGNLIDFYARRGGINLVDRKLFWHYDNGAKGKYLEGSKIIFCHTTTLGDAKNWSWFPQLGLKLKELGYSVYQVGLKTDISMGVDEKFDLRESMNFQELALTMKNSNGIFVGLDSGLSFIAASVGIKTICIMGASWSKTSGPWGENVVHIESKKSDGCASKPCHALYNICNKNAKCIDTIFEDEVIKVIQDVSSASI